MNNNIKFLLLMLTISTSIFAQNIKTAQDSALFLECSSLPVAAPQYTLSFSANSLDLNYKQDEKTSKEESLETMLANLDAKPEDVELAMQIVYRYATLNNWEGHQIYLEHAYKNAIKNYETYPDSLLIVTQLVQVLQEARNMEAVLMVWNDYVMKHSKDVRALTQYATQLALQGQVDKGKYLTQQAYEIDPKHTEVYLAAMMCEFSNTIMQLGQYFADEDSKTGLDQIAIDNTFFEKAVKVKASPAAQMAWDASQMLVLFYRTILTFSDKNIGEEKIIISPNALDAKTSSEIEKRALKQIKSKATNLYFAYKILCTIEILRGNESKAVEYWKASGSFLEKDADILRLLSFAYFLKMDFDNAILYLEKKLAFSNTYEDSYALGRFYVYKGQTDKAFEVFEKTQQLSPLDGRAICAKMSILIKKNQYKEAFALLDSYPKGIADNVEAQHVNYFKALAVLAEGDLNDALERLKNIHPDSDHKTDADKLLKHFDRK